MNLSQILPPLLYGLQNTLKLTFIGFGGGFALGLPLAIGRTYGGKIAKAISIAWIELIRGTPMLLQLFIIGFGLPIALQKINPHFTMNVFVAAALGMMINSSAYQAEYIRGAFKSIEYGQMEAAMAIGMSKWQMIRYILFPQAFRIMIPAWTNELVYLLKYSSLAMLLAVPELMYEASDIASSTFMYTKIYFLVALIYLGFATLFTQVMRLVERKLYIPGVTTIGAKRPAL